VVRIIAILLTLGGLLMAGTAAAEDRIAWRLQNPFRLFKDPKDTALHAEALPALAFCLCIG
jgi:hypothetical protein